MDTLMGTETSWWWVVIPVTFFVFIPALIALNRKIDALWDDAGPIGERRRAEASQRAALAEASSVAAADKALSRALAAGLIPAAELRAMRNARVDELFRRAIAAAEHEDARRRVQLLYLRWEYARGDDPEAVAAIQREASEHRRGNRARPTVSLDDIL